MAEYFLLTLVFLYFVNKIERHADDEGGITCYTEITMYSKHW